VTLLRALFPTSHFQLLLHIPPLAIPSAVSTQSLSLFLLVHLVIPTSLAPTFHPNTCECPSVMECLRRMASIPESRNKLASIKYDKIAYYKVQYLPPSYNGDVVFELPPNPISTSASKNTMDSMDKWFNGHTGCRTITSNIHNS
jgi:hypothetical protein